MFVNQSTSLGVFVIMMSLMWARDAAADGFWVHSCSVNFLNNACLSVVMSEHENCSATVQMLTNLTAFFFLYTYTVVAGAQTQTTE